MNLKYPFLSLKTSNEPYMKRLGEIASEVISSGSYLRGQFTHNLEFALSKYIQVPHVVATSNGLDALRLILRAYIEMGIMRPGDEIIVPANTYIATVLAITDNSLIPVFVEPNPYTLNLDTSLIEEKINMHTRAIMPVHLYGSVCFDATMKAIARDYDLIIIEDNAQAIGAVSSEPSFWDTTKTGSLGHAAGLSFYPTKNLGALGDAGAVATHDEELANTVRAIANYGSDTRYHNIYKGLNCRIDELQAAILCEKLKYLDEENAHRRIIADIYSSEIDNPLLITPENHYDKSQIWHQYVIRTCYRDGFIKYLNENGVGCDIHYAVPPFKQPCYSEYQHLDLPITETLSNEIVSIPIANISEDDAHSISNIINSFS